MDARFDTATASNASIFPSAYTANMGSGTFSYRLVDPGWEDPEGGGAGVREPRRPRLPSDAGSIALSTPA